MSRIYSTTEVKKREILNEIVRKRWDESIATVRDDVKAECIFEGHEDNNEETKMTPDIEDSVNSTGRLINQQKFCEKLVNTKVQLHAGFLTQTGKFIDRLTGPEWIKEGSFNENLMLKSLLCNVEFPDGQA